LIFKIKNIRIRNKGAAEV